LHDEELYNLYTLSDIIRIKVKAVPVNRPWRSIGGLSSAAPVIYFPGALFYSAALTLIRISRKKYFWTAVYFNFFRSTPMNTVFPRLHPRFLLYPF
jgi:hypothetical protein